MQTSSHSTFKLQNAYDDDLAIIPEIVDSAVAHFLMERLWEPMDLEIRIVPELRNRRKTTVIMGETKAISAEENKYLRPCVCKRQRAEEIQKLRMHMAFEQVRKRWREVCPDIINPQHRALLPYEYDRPIHLYMPESDDSLSTARPIATATRGGRASFSNQSIQDHVKAVRSRSPSKCKSHRYR